MLAATLLGSCASNPPAGPPGMTGARIVVVDSAPVEAELEAMRGAGFSLAEAEPPVPIKRVKPSYPARALRARVSGEVRIECVVTKRGAAESCMVVKSQAPECNAAALAAVRKWEYRPGRIRGQAIASKVTLVIQFKLQ